MPHKKTPYVTFQIPLQSLYKMPHPATAQTTFEKNLKKFTPSGFTLIELLIVVTLSIMLMLTASTVFLTFLAGNSRSTNNQLVKNEGKYALQQIEFLLRNTTELLPNTQSQTCQAGMSEIKFKSFDNGITTLMAENNKIASNSGVYLTSQSVNLVSGPVFDCAQSDDKVSQFITVTFTLRKTGNDEADQREISEETFSSSINVRTY